MIYQDALAGFALGLSLIVAIGAQNVFVLQQGLLRSHVLAVVLTCAISDAILISIGVGGFHLIAESAAWVEPFLTTGGAIFLLIYGALSMRRALWPAHAMKVGKGTEQSLTAVMLTCLAFTWLNPHVYLDTVVLMGTVSTQYDSRLAFGTGAVLSSFAFFFALGYGARRLAHVFENQTAWRVLDFCVALFMWAIALKLMLG